MRKAFISTMAGLLISTLLHIAQGAYLESDIDPTPTPSPSPVPVQPEVPRLEPLPNPGNALTDTVRRLNVGKPWSHRGLTVFPLLLDTPRTLDLQTLDEAFSRNSISVREKDPPQVDTLQVRNTSTRPIFIMNGEILAGGKQNRLVRDNLILPPGADFIDVAVYCGEKGRWSDRQESFESAGAVAHFSLRREAAMGGSQDDIWREIDAQSARVKIASPTRDYQTLYHDQTLRPMLDEYARQFRGFAGSSTVGCVAVSRGRITGADIFSDPAIFSALWDKLLRAHAMDADSPDPRHPIVSSDDVRRFLDQALSARFRPLPTPGAGQRVNIQGAANGMALVWNGALVHGCLYGASPHPVPPPPALPPPPRPPRWPRPPILPPPEPMPPHPIPLPGPIIEDNIWNFQLR